MMIQAHGAIIALCHSKQGSIDLAVGAHVALGDLIAACGNSGNSTEPRVHVHAIDRLPVHNAQAVPMLYDGQLPRNGRILEIP